MTLLSYRNALIDFDHVESVCVKQGKFVKDPVISIAIPTYNRPELAVEAVKSALCQVNDVAVEVVIVDNASDNENTGKLIYLLDELGDVPIRYYVNSDNIGMFGNWNRCISLSRGRWITILNDDDLLKKSYLRRMLSHLSLDEEDGAYCCGFSVLDERNAKGRSKTLKLFGLKNVVSAAKRLVRSRGRSVLKITPKQLFWSHLSGTGLGMLFPKKLAVSVGGFYPEEYPTADYFFHTRLALMGSLFQVMESLAVLRVRVNESQNTSTLVAIIVNNYRLRIKLLAGGCVPRSWAKMCPFLISYERLSFARMWGSELSEAEIRAATGVEERRAPRIIVLCRRLFHGAL